MEVVGGGGKRTTMGVKVEKGKKKTKQAEALGLSYYLQRMGWPDICRRFCALLYRITSYHTYLFPSPLSPLS